MESYSYSANNPITFIDFMGLGPTTDYYSSTGKHLLSTDDGSDNVVIVDKGAGCFDCFVGYLTGSKGLDQNSKRFSSASTNLVDGTEYDIGAINSFYDANEGDISAPLTERVANFTDDSGNEVEVANEHATFLYKNSDGVVTTGPENISGTSSTHIPSDRLVPSKSGSVGTLHTHPAGRKGLNYLVNPNAAGGATYGKNRGEGLASDFDRKHHAPSSGGFGVFSNKTENVFFNKGGDVVRVPKK